MENKKEDVCGKECEVFSRIVGYFRPVQRWNEGKAEEFRERLEYTEERANAGKFKTEMATPQANPDTACACAKQAA